MEHKEIDYQVLARYLAGECTSHEREMIEKWASADPKNKNQLEQFEHIWNTSSQSRQMLKDSFDAEEQWDKLQSRLHKEKEESDFTTEEEKDSSSVFRTSSVHSMTQRVARVAAIILVAGLMGVLAYQNWYQPEPSQEPILREISTDNGQRANLTLGDGTNVMLNAGSTVKFPDQFETDVREVFLEGEAYFEVVSNPDRPFVIHSRDSEIKVLGTSFSVRSYADEDQVRVVVEEGKVSLDSEDTDLEENTVLSANEMGRLNLENNEIATSWVDDMELYLSWREGYLKFREASMQKVAQELERRYAVDVIFEDESIKQKSLTAFLKSRSIRNVLDVVAMSLDIDYQLEDDKVTFSTK